MKAIGTKLRDQIHILGTNPMAYGGLNNKWTASRKSGGISRISSRFILSMENEQDDAGRDGRTCLAIPNCQARTGTREIFIFPVQLTTSRIGNLTPLILTLAII